MLPHGGGKELIHSFVQHLLDRSYVSDIVLDFDGDKVRTPLLWSSHSQVVAVLKIFSFSTWRRCGIVQLYLYFLLLRSDCNNSYTAEYLDNICEKYKLSLYTRECLTI